MTEYSTLPIEQIPMARPNLYAGADRAFPTFMAYLEEHSDLKTTEEALAAPVERHYSGEDLNEVESELEALWTTLNDIVWQIPHDHQWQDKLVLLLLALAERPPPPGPKRPIWGVYLWINLPLFGPGMREGWNSPLSVVKERENSATRETTIGLLNRDKHQVALRRDYTRMNAFLARVSHLPQRDLELHAIWAMREALEEPLEPAELHLNVPGAAVWIYYAGNWIFSCQKSWEPGFPIGDPAVGGSLWEGSRGFSRGRWDLWRQRFRWIAENSEVQQETRDYAWKAAEEMERIESSANH